MKRNEFIQLFEELSKIGSEVKEDHVVISSSVSDSFDLVSDCTFTIEVERAMTVRTEGIRTYKREQIKFRITK